MRVYYCWFQFSMVDLVCRAQLTTTNHLLYCLLLGVGPRWVEEGDQTHEAPPLPLVCARHGDAAHAAARVVVDLVGIGSSEDSHGQQHITLLH